MACNPCVREPGGALHRGPPTGVWNPTAALVIEVVSPGDESWDKLPFYAAHRVDEVLIVDPRERTVDWLALGEDEHVSEDVSEDVSEGEYAPVERSRLIEMGPGELAEQIGWPAG